MMTRVLSLMTLISFLFISLAQAEDLQRREFLTQDLLQQNGMIKVAFFDADSTLRVSKSGLPSANGAYDYIILPGVAEKIHELNQEHFLVVIISNQAGIPKYITLDQANAALSNMIQDLRRLGAQVDYYDFAELDNEDRKPGIGMAVRLEELLEKRGLQIDKRRSYMVGDSAYLKAKPGKDIPGEIRPDGRPGFNFSNSDRLFAENYGIAFFEPQYFFGWIKYNVETIDKSSDLDTFQ
ncbi:MAG: HAD-IIIA family hydrolase [Bdellovibrionaceae bacterium]|nr:HAD-IIIA family hydrolase [Pseudobdellovibrionaceae bacterium]